MHNEKFAEMELFLQLKYKLKIIKEEANTINFFILSNEEIDITLKTNGLEFIL